MCQQRTKKERPRVRFISSKNITVATGIPRLILLSPHAL